MSCASPIFRIMLGSHFKEGTILATSGSMEIPLPEDDIDAMTIICRVLHGWHGAVDKQFLCNYDYRRTLPEFLKLCDKYDLKPQVESSVCRWLHEGLEAGNKGELYKGQFQVLLAVADADADADVFDCKDEIVDIAKSMNLNLEQSIQDFGCGLYCNCGYKQEARFERFEPVWALGK